MPVKVVFYFKYLEQGWSESFYRSSAFTGSDTALLDQYLNRRMKLASTEVNLISVRTSDVNSARDVEITEIPFGGIWGSWVYDANGNTAPNQTAQAILLRLSDGAQHYRSFQMLGLPDHVIQDNTINEDEEAILRGRLNDWRDAIAQAGFQMRINSAPTVFGLIDGYGTQTDAAPLVKILTTATLPAKGDLIQISGSQPWKMLNRTWRVAASGGGQFSLARSKALQVYGEVEGGKWKKPVYAYPGITSYTYGRVSVRKTGVPFGVQRGRRSSRM